MYSVSEINSILELQAAHVPPEEIALNCGLPLADIIKIGSLTQEAEKSATSNRTITFAQADKGIISTIMGFVYGILNAIASIFGYGAETDKPAEPASAERCDESEVANTETIRSRSNSQEQIHGRQIGIENPSNCCWLISALQMIINTPSLLQAVMTRNDIPVTKKFIQNYILQAQGPRHDAYMSNVAAVLAELSEVSGGIINNPNLQQDASEAVRYLLQGTGFDPQVDVMKVSRDGLKQTDRSQKLDSIVQMKFDETNIVSFPCLFRNAFISKTDQGYAHEFHFKKAPDDLLVQIVRTVDYVGTKKTDAIKDIPADGALYLPGVGDVNYICDGFIRHMGDTAGSGHYVSYFKNGNQWTCCSDGDVWVISEQEVAKAVAHADLFHFTKK